MNISTNVAMLKRVLAIRERTVCAHCSRLNKNNNKEDSMHFEENSNRSRCL